MKRINYVITVILAMALFASCGKESKEPEENFVDNLNLAEEAEEQNEYQKDEEEEIEKKVEKVGAQDEQPESPKEVDNSRWEWFIEPGKYSDIVLYDENFIAVADSSGKYGFLDGDKNLIVEHQYTHVAGVSEQIARVTDQDYNYLFLDYNGKLITEESFPDANDFSEGLAAVEKEGGWGFIDKNGSLRIDFQYEDAGNFREGKAAVAKTMDGYQEWAYINEDNEVVVDYWLCSAAEGRMELAGEFHDGYALITSDLYCLIDEEGKTVLGKNNPFFLTGGSVYGIEPGWMAAYDYTDDSMTEEKYGFVDINGRIKVPFIFEHVSEIHGDLAAVRYERGGKTEAGVIRLKLRSYDSHREFPYGSMEYVDEKNYAFLKKTYDEIDFTGEYQMGNQELCEKYRKEYKKLVDNEITFTDPETGETYYLKEYGGLKVYKG